MAASPPAVDAAAAQQFRRDRRELLSFLLSASVLKKVVMPPGAVALEDVDLDQVSVDHVLDCAKKGAALDLAQAIKRYHEDLRAPPRAGQGLSEVFFLVTAPELSGDPPRRAPPPNEVDETPPQSFKSFSRASALSTPTRISGDDLYDDDLEDEEGDERDGPRRTFSDASDLALLLPPLPTGLSNDDLRETGYEILLAAVGSSGALAVPVPQEERPKEDKKKLMRRFSRSRSSKDNKAGLPSPVARVHGLAGILETIRLQLEIADSSDRRTRTALLHAAGTRGGRHMDTLLLPLELLAAVPPTAFADRKSYMSWEKRMLRLLEEGLLNHPVVRLEHSNPLASHLSRLIQKTEDSESMPSPAGPAQQAEAIRAMRDVGQALAERAGRGDETGEVCHWADGYHLNILIYQQLLLCCFDLADDTQLVEEVEEIQDTLKQTWHILGITTVMHDSMWFWVLFRQYVLTGEDHLLELAKSQLKRIPSQGQRSVQELKHMHLLVSVIEDSRVSREFTMMQSILSPVKEWADKRLLDCHTYFPEGGQGKMDSLLTLAVITGRLLADEDDHVGVGRISTVAEKAAVSQQVEQYVSSSVRAAYDRVLTTNRKAEAQQGGYHLAVLATEIQMLAKGDAQAYAPVFARYNPSAVGITASSLHQLYHRELAPFVKGVTHLTEEVEAVLPAADRLDNYLRHLVSELPDTGSDASLGQSEKMVSYEVATVSGTLVMRWINNQLSKINEWIDRALFSESWEAVSPQQRYGPSVVEVFRIIEETLDQFFALKLPLRMNLLKALSSGIDNALQLYCTRISSQLGSKEDLIPPDAPLTRFKKDVAAKVALTATKKGRDPRLPDEQRTAQINALTIPNLCIRLNTLHYVLGQAQRLEDSMQNRWAQLRPQDERPQANGKVNHDRLHHPLSLLPFPISTLSPSRRLGPEDQPLRRRLSSKGDELNSAFDPCRKALNTAIDKICDFTGTKVVFWDMRTVFLDNLYQVSVAQNRMEKVVTELDPVLGQLCEVIAEALRDRVVLGLLQATLDGLLRVLLDGGPTRSFAQEDSDMLEEDLNVLKEFFVADGDGLPRGVVENTTAPVQQILNLYSLDTHVVVENFKHASEVMVTSGNSAHRSRSATDADTLLRVLCHRADRNASKFLKTQYKLPKITS
eukprot:SM000082S22811  [mRNA]  locus=s82:26155:33864:- [translate_table: standard]